MKWMRISIAVMMGIMVIESSNSNPFLLHVHQDFWFITTSQNTQATTRRLLIFHNTKKRDNTDVHCLFWISSCKLWTDARSCNTTWSLCITSYTNANNAPARTNMAEAISCSATLIIASNESICDSRLKDHGDDDQKIKMLHSVNRALGVLQPCQLQAVQTTC